MRIDHGALVRLFLLIALCSVVGAIFGYLLIGLAVGLAIALAGQFV